MTVKKYIKPLGIGTLKTKHNIILAPLAGISDYPFRQINREFGADLTFSEMVSVDGWLHGNSATRSLLEFRETEKPFGIQLFGHDPDSFTRIVPLVQTLNPSVVDINFGCPVKKVVKRGAGAALLKDLKQMENIVRQFRGLSIPVSAKIRLGWNGDKIVAEEAAQAVQSGGANFITVHARTKSQGYSGKADWEYIARVKQAVSIPVIGNGDVVDGRTAQAMFEETYADGIMVARGALGKPWIFQSILNYPDFDEAEIQNNFTRRFEILQKHYRLNLQEYGEELSLKIMKKHFIWYTRGMPHTAALRNKIFRVNNYPEVENLFTDYLTRYAGNSVELRTENIHL